MFLVILALLGIGSATWICVRHYNFSTLIGEIERVGGYYETREGGLSWLSDWLGDAWVLALPSLLTSR